jgi:hypothetical protein
MGCAAPELQDGAPGTNPPASFAVTARMVVARCTERVGILGDLSGHDRIEAVHQNFSGRSSSDALEAVFWVGLFGVLLIGLLLLLHRGQRFLQKRRNARTAPPNPRPRRPPYFAPPSSHPRSRPLTPRSPVKSRT